MGPIADIGPQPGNNVKPALEQKYGSVPSEKGVSNEQYYVCDVAVATDAGRP